ncbi:homocysteine S-methyltransferase family protein [Pelagibaculum spongiae]|uniref:Homocysteine methyltransferase n=1 Tax=Pelagibaculum spongiae TaxID=2080658 RepID=A0A2V1GZ43_9GAMM|nr:homocysteine S-methyltransferase family protein [Pelagibaculum spongiae]PVZ68326.1 homocysteine methyltransferase [Pelagibaculum spongiae]
MPQTSFSSFLENSHKLLVEGAILQRLQQAPGVELSSQFAHACAIYDSNGKTRLTNYYRQYLDIAQDYQLPILLGSATWHATSERLAESGQDPAQVNQDNVDFIRQLSKPYGGKAWLGGIMGCRFDTYSAEQALSADQAEFYHREQAEMLAQTDVDFLHGVTLPATSEAIGLGRAMAATGKDYILSFVLRNDGRLLDGNSLEQAIAECEADSAKSPICYFVNCTHPQALRLAFSMSENIPLLQDRLWGIQGNSFTPPALESASDIELDEVSPEEFAREMLALHSDFGLRALGGCCGTNQMHLEAIARGLPLAAMAS